MITFAFLITANLLVAQNIKFKNDSVKHYIDKTLSIIQDNALNNNKINWEALRIDIYEKTKRANNVQEILFIYPCLFQKIKGHHGWLSYKNKNYQWNKESQTKDNDIVKDAVKKYTASSGKMTAISLIERSQTKFWRRICWLYNNKPRF